MSMLAEADPREAYRRSNVEARLHCGDGAALVLFCLEETAQSLGALLIACRRRDPAARSRWLTRAIASITALELGIDRTAPMAGTLIDFYGGAKLALLDCVREMDEARIAALKEDFREVRAALTGQSYVPPPAAMPPPVPALPAPRP